MTFNIILGVRQATFSQQSVLSVVDLHTALSLRQHPITNRSLHLDAEKAEVGTISLIVNNKANFFINQLIR